MRLLINIYNK